MKEKILPSDRLLAVLTCALVFFGIVMVYDASYPHGLAHYGDGWYFAKKQIFSAAVGLLAFRVCSRLDYTRWRPWALAGYLLSVVLLVVVWKAGHGALGGQRWIRVGPVQFQPSEFAKLSLILVVAAALSWRPRLIHRPAELAGLCLVAFIPILLTERQPDLGTASTMLLAFLVMLLAAGTRVSRVAIIAGVCVLGAAGTLMLPSKKSATVEGGAQPNYRVRRLMSFVDPGKDRDADGLQNWHSLVALANGGVTGVGFTNSMEKRIGGVPMQRTDFIFSVAGEELGLIGSGALLMAYLLLAVRGYGIACRSREPFGQLLAVGVTTIVAGQAALNIAVVTSSIPTTGIPLPLVSYGGSALVPTLAGLGILLNISRIPFRRTGAGETAPASERPGADVLRRFGGA